MNTLLGDSMIIARSLSWPVLFIASALAITACNEVPLSYGDANSIIAVMSTEAWAEVQDDVYSALEPTVITVRAEKTFTVTYQEPGAAYWENLRRFRQMVVVGSRDDHWVQEVLEDAREPITENGIHQVYDVWSRGQTITLILMDQEWDRADLLPYLPRVNELLDGQFRRYAQNRMYMSGTDSALADTLSLRAGFSMMLPMVYRWQTRDSVYIFRNDNPDPSELIRQIGLTWITPASDELRQDRVVAWRNEMAEAHYTEPQLVVLEGLVERRVDLNGIPSYEFQSQWRNPPDRGWPAGGPLITRVVTCDSQDRTYLLDAWLYAPGKEKYEYMIQLETLLNTFKCL
ncbi:MAG: hypothetical protein CME18_10630 [Gemmatimonadetes bacterium]|nr:hypothetical protein [Gemmatimonadota bacterium]